MLFYKASLTALDTDCSDEVLYVGDYWELEEGSVTYRSNDRVAVLQWLAEQVFAEDFKKDSRYKGK
jgi:hypothetical protein